MKACALLLITIILTCLPAITLGKTTLDENKVMGGPTNNLFGHAFNLKVQVFDASNQYSAVSLSGQIGLECTTVGSSGAHIVTEGGERMLFRNRIIEYYSRNNIAKIVHKAVACARRLSE